VQQVMTLGFDWDSKEMSVMFMAKLAKPLMGTARVIINSIHIKGDVCLLLSPLVMLLPSYHYIELESGLFPIFFNDVKRLTINIKVETCVL
jgi:hypothetical protein